MVFGINRHIFVREATQYRHSLSKYQDVVHIEDWSLIRQVLLPPTLQAAKV